MSAEQVAALLTPAETAGLGAAAVQALQRAHARLVRVDALPDKPEDTPLAATRALWCRAAGQPMSAVAALLAPLPALDDAGLAAFDNLVEQRVSGVPLAHLVERQRFMGLELLAGPQALIPRQETELLGEAAAVLLAEAAAQRGEALAIDVCTGCGNLALALAARVPQARVHAADLSAEAVALARRNTELLGVGDRVALHEGDLLAPFDTPAFIAKVDVLTCNPPYISSARLSAMAAEIAVHEPALAFDGGPLGIRILQRLLREAPRFLRPGGWLAFEVGAGQGSGVLRRLGADAHYSELRSVSDAHGEVRAVLARRSA
ncbi:N5-glutamine methyltransferase family protein [Ideonella sp. BN130291]|uniref:N5-glutamine methyltransferase family protein n=1 Tax=Ideonella sp. BN130291 TaxID=3112940 RepID=UPI002E27628B|nr:HemK/PrmC family methyltransferase [Ideonella sp. BN130291]